MNVLPLPEGTGALGLAPCPGWHSARTPSPATRLALERDLAALAAAGTTMLVTLVAWMSTSRRVASAMHATCAALGIEWAHCPIHDMQVPGPAFERAWSVTGRRVHERLDAGQLVTLHCRAGYGRARAPYAAQVLRERNIAAADAIALVHQHRPGTIETIDQSLRLGAPGRRAQRTNGRVIESGTRNLRTRRRPALRVSDPLSAVRACSRVGAPALPTWLRDADRSVSGRQ